MTANIEGLKDSPRNYGRIRDKELKNAFILAGRDAQGNQHTWIDARLYMGRSSGASVVYCIVWMHPTNGARYSTGYGKATGGNYHKASAALDSAFERAGIVLSAPIDGRGEGAMRDAIRAVGCAIGAPDCAVLVEVGA